MSPDVAHGKRLLTPPPVAQLREDPDQLIELACHGLATAAPEYSAWGVFVPWQRVTLIVLAIAALAGLLVAPAATCIVIIAVVTIAYAVALGYRFVLFRYGARGDRMVTVSDEEAHSVPDDQLPVYTVLVIDATTGQNGLQQAREFNRELELDALIVTKLDGTARGGIALAVSHELELPIIKIGVGEGLDDLRDFDAHDFARALVGAFDQRQA